MPRVVDTLVVIALLAALSACGEVEKKDGEGGELGDANGDAGTENGDAGTDSGADCESGANGFLDIPDTLRGTSAYELDVGPAGSAQVILYYGDVEGDQRGWAMIDGDTRAGDLVWMDWTENGGDDWIRCGPFPVDMDGSTRTTAAQRTANSPDWQFRACGQAAELDPVCGSWW